MVKLLDLVLDKPAPKGVITSDELRCLLGDTGCVLGLRLIDACDCPTKECGLVLLSAHLRPLHSALQ